MKKEYISADINIKKVDMPFVLDGSDVDIDVGDDEEDEEV